MRLLVQEAADAATSAGGVSPSWPAAMSKEQMQKRFIGALVQLQDDSLHAIVGVRGGDRLTMTADTTGQVWHVVDGVDRIWCSQQRL